MGLLTMPDGSSGTRGTLCASTGTVYNRYLNVITLPAAEFSVRVVKVIFNALLLPLRLYSSRILDEEYGVTLE